MAYRLRMSRNDGRITSMKVSVSLPSEDVAFLNESLRALMSLRRARLSCRLQSRRFA